jgi:hypothetical protein
VSFSSASAIDGSSSSELGDESIDIGNVLYIVGNRGENRVGGDGLGDG